MSQCNVDVSRSVVLYMQFEELKHQQIRLSVTNAICYLEKTCYSGISVTSKIRDFPFVSTCTLSAKMYTSVC